MVCLTLAVARIYAVLDSGCLARFSPKVRYTLQWTVPVSTARGHGGPNELNDARVVCTEL